MAKVRFSQGLEILDDFEPVYLDAPEDPPEPKPEEPEKEPEHTIGSLVKDTAIDVAKGIVGVPEASVGIYDIATGGRAGQLMENLGVRFEDTQEFLEEQRSEAGKAAKRKVAEAQGVVDTTKAVVQNPSTILSTVAESTPLMLGGGAVGQGVRAVAPRVPALIAGAIGEGAITAGGMAEQVRQESDTGQLTGQQSAYAVGSGLATSLLGVGGGKIAKWLGISDIDTVLAGKGAEQVRKNFVRRIAEGGLTEGVFEELPQSLQEQALTNLATGKPWTEGLDQAGVMGALSGGVMGGAAQVLPQTTVESQPVIDDTPDAPEPTPTPQDPARAELASTLNAEIDTGNYVNLTDEELGVMLGDARSLETEAPGSVDLDALQAEVDRRASLGTMAKAAEVAERALQRDPTAMTSTEELAAQAAEQEQEQEQEQQSETAETSTQQPQLEPGISDQSADILALEQEQDDGIIEQVPEVAGFPTGTGADNGMGSGTAVQLAAATGPSGTTGLGRPADSPSSGVSATDSAALEPAGAQPDAVAIKQEIAELRQQLAPLMTTEKAQGGLNGAEGQEFVRITNRINQLRFQTATPATPAQVAPEAKRMSTLAPEVNTTAYNDLIRNYDVYEPLMAAVTGVYINSTTPVDDVLLGQNPKVTPEQLYSAFDATREALRAQYGDTITLYRSPTKQRKKPTTNWATTKEFAKQFGDKIIKKTFSVEEVIAAVVNPDGRYHELIMGKPPATVIQPEAPEPRAKPKAKKPKVAKEVVPAYETGAEPSAEGSSIVFEVAPDPHDVALTDRWNKVPHLQKVAISGNIAAEIIPRALDEVGIQGEVSTQLGGYLDETNPSFTLRAAPGTDPAKLVEAAKLAGFVLSQDSMMVVNDKPFEGADPTGIIKVKFPGDPKPEQVHDVYMKIRQASGGDIMGHSTVGNTMQIMVDLADADRLYKVVKGVLAKEPGRYATTIKRDAYWAFIGKEDYDNGSDRSGRGKGTLQEGRSVLRGRDSLRAEASRLIEEALNENEQGSKTESGQARQVAEPKGAYGLTKAEVEALPDAQQKARTTALASIDRLRRHTDSLLALGIAKDFKQRGSASLIGKQVKSSEDLAVAAQVLRDPRFETFRYFFTKGSEIIDQVSVTSRLPGSTLVEPVKGPIYDVDAFRFTREITRRAKRNGADGVYIMHNHPSGDPTPSEADRTLTQYISSVFREEYIKYHGHVIINHQSYTVLDDLGQGEPQLKEFKNTYNNDDPAIPHGYLGAVIDGHPALAAIGKAVASADDTVVILGQSGTRGLRAIWEVKPVSMSETKMAAMLRHMAKSTGSQQLFVYNLPFKYMGRASRAVRSGLLVDAIIVDPNDGNLMSLRYHLAEAPDGRRVLGQPMRGYVVKEEVTGYDDPTQNKVDKTAKRKASSKAKSVLPNTPASGGSPNPAPASATTPPGVVPPGIAKTGVGAPPNPLSWNAPPDSKIDDLLHKLQDKHIDTKRVIQTLKNVADKFDPYLQEELYHGRVATRVHKFLNQELKPLLTALHKTGITMQEFEEFLHNRHAEEANKYIASLDGGMPDGGSGINTADARAYLAKLPAAKLAKLAKLSLMVDNMIAETRRELVSYGLESPATIQAWENAYKFYVPLHREDMDAGHGNGTGQGFSVRGSSSKRRTGSSRNVVDILAHIATQREVAITRGEKNRVALALYGLALQNPNSDFWEADNPPKQKDVLPGLKTYEVYYAGSKVYESDNKQLAQEYLKNANLKHGTGSHTLKVVQGPDRIVTSVNPRYKSEPNVVVARMWNPKTGEVEDRTVTFNKHNKRALRMAESLKNLDVDQLGTALGVFSKATRWFASVNTQYNPIFGALNFMRDVQAAGLNLTSTPLAKHKAKVMGEAAVVLRSLYKDLRADRKGSGKQSKYAAVWDEFQSMGGKTGYRDVYRNSQERSQQLANDLKAMASRNPTKRSARAVLDWLTDFNDTAENAVRLAAYIVAKENGMSKERAASLAKNLTVNFNRKGAKTAQVGALFAFFNASVQGTARIYETLSGPAGKKIVAGGILLGVMQQLMLAMAGFDDDDPPDFVRERSFIIPWFNKDKDYFAIPYPLGYNALPNIGRIATQWMLNDFERPTDHAIRLTGILLNSFNPVSGGDIAQAITPTVFDPVLAIYTNKDWTGRSIAREDFNANEPTPGFSRAKDTSTPHANWLSHVFNRLSGGTQYTAGKFSPSPDQIDYLIGQIGGGVLRESNKISQTITSAFTGEELPTYKVPFFGRFYGKASGASHQRNVFYANMSRMHEHELEVKGRLEDKLPVDEYLAENPEARLIGYAARTQRKVSQLNRRRHDMIRAGASKAEVKKLEDNITRIVERFNTRYTALAEGSEEQAAE